MFKERLISSVILLAITIFTVIMGGNILFAAILVISVIGLHELYKIVGIHNKLIGYIGYLVSIIFDTMLLLHLEEYSFAYIIGFLMILMGVYVFSFPEYHTDQITLIFFGFFYVSIMLSYIYQVRMLRDGAILVWLIFIGAWGSDTCAYCVGMLIGKHKMSPKLSPKKSIEGAIGGILGAALIGGIYGTILNSYLNIANPQIIFAIIGGCASIISQIGDLAASAIKRDHNIKDYSKLIPGHGGILDRFDSIIFTAPIVYYLAKLLIK
ncbi:phosphatidate cytidylyltransferase [Mobilisporobacter senegalensis]|uniref:Phosphatidate cytidylyltransferase n=1 Tax=Mobilisporobacter senegalensis TaxID=1329262 RepID=A0A3N1XVZ8_9FIRM|nr:phosphatidate cytidylyltransferase [Mobilisporobacter senegalensis]ROR30805.1 phosphatidate cytidylyltransferase [Mobilisporobacter senegalensis]